MTAAIDARGVTVRYGEVVALSDVTVQIAPGVVCALIGMNGSGKSTLFTALMGLARPAAGEIRLGGLSPASARAQGIVGYMPQSEQIDWSFPVSVEDVVMMGRYGRQGPTRRVRPADRAAVADALARVELTGLAHRQIGALSGGQRKRAFLARAIAQEARVLLLDEPFAGVDKRSEATIVQLLGELAAGGATVLISTHDLHALPALAAEAILLKNRVLMHGPVAEVLRPENIARAFGWEPGLDAAGAPAEEAP